MTEREVKTLKKIRKYLGKQHKPYMFWFIDDGRNWEGGTELSLDQQSRNQYTIPAPSKHVVKNW